jgi:transcription antitermination factor NusG
MVTESCKHPWFALQTRFRHEEIVARHLQGKGFESFLPVYKCRRRWSDRMKELDLPLFPGYLFCRFDPAARLPILTVPGVARVVGIGRTLVPIEEDEIAAIQRVVHSDLPRQPWPFLRVGQQVRVVYGPLSGTEGILLSFRGRCRLILSVNLLHRSVAVDVDGGWVVPASPSPSRLTRGTMLPPAA